MGEADPIAAAGLVAGGAGDEAAQPAEAGTGTAEYHEQLGSTFFDNGQYAQAEKSYREAIRLDAGNARYFHNLGTVMFARKRYRAAEAAELKAIILAPGNADYHNHLGKYVLEQKRYADAEAAFRRSLELSPDQPAFLNDLGRSLFPRELYEEAEAVQRRAIEIGTSETVGKELYSQFYNNLGDSLFSQGRSQEAEDAYREACSIDPGSARNHNDFGATLFRLGKYAEAKDEFQKALEGEPEGEPENALFHNNLATALFALGNYTEAERESRIAIQFDNRGTYRHDLGTTLVMQQRYDEAESEFGEAMRLDGADARYLNSLGLCLFYEQRFMEAETAARQATVQAPEAAKYRDNLVSILAAHARRAIESGNLTEAAGVLREISLIRPGNAADHANLARVLFGAEELTEAETEYRAAIGLAPGTASYYNNLGATLLARARRDRIGDPAARAPEPVDGSRAQTVLLVEAEAAFKKAIELDPADVGYKSNLSGVFFYQQSYAEAESQLRDAISLEPANDAFHSNLAYALFKQQRPNEAEEAYREAVRLGGGKGKHYDNLGTALLVSLKNKSAEREYRRAIECAESPDLIPEYGLHLTAALSALGRYEEAAGLLSGIVNGEPDNPVFRDALATAQYHLRAYSDAESEERTAIRLAASAEQRITYHANLARILIHQQRLSEAERELTALNEATANSASVSGLLGYILDQTGQVAEAEANYRRSLSIEANVAVRCNLGILLARNRRFGDAAEESQRALDESPSAWMPHYALGLLALEQADEYGDDSYYDDGAHHFKRAIGVFNAQVPENVQSDSRANLYLNLGYAYGKLGQSGRALAEFRSAMKASRKHSRMWFTAESNVRRYQRREQATGSQRPQVAVFIGLGIIVFAAIGALEWRNGLTPPYLVALLALGIALFVFAFYLPIVTNIRLGPVSLEKQAVELRSDPPQLLPSPGNSLGSTFEAWEDTQLDEAKERLRADIGKPTPTATDPRATEQETPPRPEPLGARLSR